MHKVKEVMEQRRQRMTVNGNETRAQRPAAAHCQSLPLAADNVNMNLKTIRKGLQRNTRDVREDEKEIDSQSKRPRRWNHMAAVVSCKIKPRIEHRSGNPLKWRTSNASLGFPEHFIEEFLF